MKNLFSKKILLSLTVVLVGTQSITVTAKGRLFMKLAEIMYRDGAFPGAVAGATLSSIPSILYGIDNATHKDLFSEKPATQAVIFTATTSAGVVAGTTLGASTGILCSNLKNFILNSTPRIAKQLVPRTIIGAGLCGLTHQLYKENSASPSGC